MSEFAWATLDLLKAIVDLALLVWSFAMAWRGYYNDEWPYDKRAFYLAAAAFLFLLANA